MQDNLGKYVIYVLLCIIILFGTILLYKMSRTTRADYDKKIYEEVYGEMDDLLDIDNNEKGEDIDEEQVDSIVNAIENIGVNNQEYTVDTNGTSNKKEYNYKNKNIAGVLLIPKIEIRYPVLKETTTENLKIGPCKYAGPDANKIGNFCIVGHNYRDSTHFSNLDKMDNGDSVKLYGNDGTMKTYKVYEKRTIEANDFSCINQDTQGKRILTLITCSNLGKKRLLLKCVDI